MIHKTFLLAFLSLQSSDDPQTSGKGNAASEVAVRIDVLQEPATAFQSAEFGSEKSVNRIDYLNTPKIHTGSDDDDDAQVPMEIPSGQEEFNKVPSGSYDPGQVSFPDGFEILAQLHTYELKDAFPKIPPPPGISRVWGLYPAGRHFEAFFRGGGGHVTNFSIKYGWIENGALTAGSYKSQILTLNFRGWSIEEGPSGSLKRKEWETTKNIETKGDRFVFDFSGGPPDKALVVSRVFYVLL